MIPAKIYPLTIPGNGSFALPVVGDYFQVLSADGSFTVTGDSFNTMGTLKPGQGLKNTPFQRLTFTDLSGAANSLTVLVAGEDFVNDRIVGDVSILDTIMAGVQHNYFSGGLAVGTLVTQILATAANPLGAVVKAASVQIFTGTGGACSAECALIAAAAAPVSMAGGAARIVLAHASASTGTATPSQAYCGNMALSRHIPAGWGLWRVDIAGTLAGAAVANLDYQLDA